MERGNEPLDFYRLDQRPDLASSALDLNDRVWPKFLDSTPSGIRFWECLYHEFAAFQIVALNKSGALVGCGHTIPVWWDGSVDGLPVGWDDMLSQGVLRMRAGAAVNTLAALAVTIDPLYQGKGLSPLIIKEMQKIAFDYGYKRLIAPVRPTMKADYPNASIEDYITWVNEKGESFDPWIRTHLRMQGSRLLGIANHSMVVQAPISEWQEWVDLDIDPEQQEVVIPKALTAARIDQEAQMISYHEPNVWIMHTADER